MRFGKRCHTKGVVIYFLLTNINVPEAADNKMASGNLWSSMEITGE